MPTFVESWRNSWHASPDRTAGRSRSGLPPGRHCPGSNPSGRYAGTTRGCGRRAPCPRGRLSGHASKSPLPPIRASDSSDRADRATKHSTDTAFSPPFRECCEVKRARNEGTMPSLLAPILHHNHPFCQYVDIHC